MCVCVSVCILHLLLLSSGLAFLMLRPKNVCAFGFCVCACFCCILCLHSLPTSFIGEDFHFGIVTLYQLSTSSPLHSLCPLASAQLRRIGFSLRLKLPLALWLYSVPANLLSLVPAPGVSWFCFELIIYLICSV